MSSRTFPTGFLWGVAGAGHQIEGNNTNSDTWFLEHVSPTVFREPSLGACNSYELWREDIDLVFSNGLRAYRFSVEWARVEPVQGEFDPNELAHYRAIAERCKELGISVIVTFNHFTAPHWFGCAGAWMHPDSAQWFATYCDRVMQEFGAIIDYAVTLNEPDLPRLLSWFNLPQFIRDLERATLEAASKATGVANYRTGNVIVAEDFDGMQAGMTAAHIAGKAAIKSYRSDLPVGFSLAVMDDIVVGDDASVRDRKRAEVYQHWLELARDDDFIGVQNYETVRFDGNGMLPHDPSKPVNQMGSNIDAGSLAGAVRYVYEQTHVPILVTEHGMATADDTQRAAFIEPALVALHEAMTDGVPVVGYTHWTLLDNFEWIFGYGSQLGLCAVDRETYVRTPKPSFYVLGEVARANAVKDPSS